MMSEKFLPRQHTPDVLAAQISGLPDNYAVVGSLGRCILLGELKPLKRADGSPVDIDAIDVTGQDTRTASSISHTFRVDCGLTSTLRPVSSFEWGLFLNGHDLFCTIDAEHCEPQMQSLGWAQGSAPIIPAPIQVELTHIKPGNYKNADLNKRFADMTASRYPALPHDVQRKFKHFKRINAQFERFGSPDQPYSNSERAYRSLRRSYLRYSPGLLQMAVDTTLGSLVRAHRGTRL